MWRWGKTRCARCRHPLDPSSTSPCANCRLPRKKLKKSKGFGKTNCAKCGEGLNRRGVCTTCTKVPPYTKIRRLSYDSSHRPKKCEPPGEGYCECKGICDNCCTNRLDKIECTGRNCKNGESCTNRVLQQRSYAGECKPSLEPRKGWGLAILNNVKKGDVLQEYVGEVVSKRELDSRQDKSYAFFLGKGWFVDSRLKGNETRFVNHCCEPNCRFESWKVNGYTRLAFCAARDIKAGEFLSCDYRWDTSKGCQCDSPNCKGRLNGRRERRSRGRPPSKKGHSA